MLTSSNNHTLNNDDAGVMDMTSDTAERPKMKVSIQQRRSTRCHHLKTILCLLFQTLVEVFSQDINEEMPTVEDRSY